MGAPVIKYYPRRSPSDLKTVTFPDGSWRKLDARYAIDGAQSVTHGRSSFAVMHGCYQLIELETNEFSREHDPAFFKQLRMWDSHALAGGLFQMAYDGSLVSSTTIATQTLHSTTALTVASSTGFLAGQWVAFEDATDQTIRGEGLISSIPDGTHITLTAAIDQIFVVGTTLRHIEYWPICRLIENKSPYSEGDNGLWKFKGTIETVAA